MPSLLDDEPQPAVVAGTSHVSRARQERARKLKVIASIGMLVIAAGLLVWQVMGTGPSDATLSRQRDVIDSRTGTVFLGFRIPADTRFPWVNPSTGEPTLFPAEKCFYTKDGGAKTEPTYVLLRSYRGESGDTTCPDCGRKVVAHNPAPLEELARMANEKNGKK